MIEDPMTDSRIVTEKLGREWVAYYPDDREHAVFAERRDVAVRVLVEGYARRRWLAGS